MNTAILISASLVAIILIFLGAPRGYTSSSGYDVMTSQSPGLFIVALLVIVGALFLVYGVG